MQSPLPANLARRIARGPRARCDHHQGSAELPRGIALPPEPLSHRSAALQKRAVSHKPNRGQLLIELRLVATCTGTRYSGWMIRTFRHKGMKRLFEKDNAIGVRADRSARIRDVLAHLDWAEAPTDFDLPGYRLHALKGRLKGYWSVNISGNWRIIFSFENGDAFDVDLVDYH
ncbi:MAG: type II toxin-antitoxin system RelE/ParE family toxin [Bryobacteraceae bacterium]